MEFYGAGEVAPCKGITRADWVLKTQQSSRTTLSGETDVIEFGPSYWEVTLDIALPDRTDFFDVWSAFIARRRGQAQTFLMSRAFRPKPKIVTVSSNPSAAVVNYAGPSSILQMTGVGGWKPQIGDMVSYETPGGGLWIGQVVANDDGLGDPISFQVEPKTVEPKSGGGSPRIFDALGEFSLSGQPRFSEGHKRRSLRFSAKQVLR